MYPNFSISYGGNQNRKKHMGSVKHMINVEFKILLSMGESLVQFIQFSDRALNAELYFGEGDF